MSNNCLLPNSTLLEIHQKLQQTGLKFEELHGGLVNHVYRIRAESSQASIAVVKYAGPTLKCDASLAFSTDRQLFEARALAILGEGGYMGELFPTSLHNNNNSATTDKKRFQFKARVKIPSLLHYSQAGNFLLMSDLGNHPKILEYLMANPRVDVARRLGGELGQWMAELHGQSFEQGAELAGLFNNYAKEQVIKDYVMQCYSALMVDSHFPDTLRFTKKQEKFIEKYLVNPLRTGVRLAHSSGGLVLCMGDLWPNSIMISSSDGGGGGGGGEEILLYDWEFAGYGHPGEDIGHFCALFYTRSLLFKHQPSIFSAMTEFLDSFLKSYHLKSTITDLKDLYERCLWEYGVGLFCEAAFSAWCVDTQHADTYQQQGICALCNPQLAYAGMHWMKQSLDISTEEEVVGEELRKELFSPFLITKKG